MPTSAFQQIDLQDSNRAQVRQNLIHPHQYIQRDQQIPQQQIVIQPLPPAPHPTAFRQVMLYIPAQQTPFPIIPISGYKFYIQICLFFGCYIQMLFVNWTFIHLLWVVWYASLGFWRYNIFYRKVRFWAELFNLTLWVVTNCYIFSSNNHKQTIFPLLILLLNLDFYFIGSGLVLTYFCFISYIIYQFFADVRLKMIDRRLQQRQKYLIQNLMNKFLQNEQNHKKNKQCHSSYNLKDQIQMQQKGKQVKQDENLCPICLSQLDLDKIENQKTIRLFCNHRYHYGCLKGWIQNNQSSCPVCRRQMGQ